MNPNWEATDTARTDPKAAAARARARTPFGVQPLCMLSDILLRQEDRTRGTRAIVRHARAHTHTCTFDGGLLTFDGVLLTVVLVPQRDLRAVGLLHMPRHTPKTHSAQHTRRVMPSASATSATIYGVCTGAHMASEMTPRKQKMWLPKGNIGGERCRTGILA